MASEMTTATDTKALAATLRRARERSLDAQTIWELLGRAAEALEVLSSSGSSERPPITGVMCGGCGLPYQEHGCDVTLPDDQWRVVNGREGGVLCGTCIAQRAGGIPGSIAIRARIEFAGEPTKRTPEFERGYFAGSGDWAASAAAIEALEQERDAARTEALQLREELNLANEEAMAALTPEGQANAIAQLREQLRVERAASSETQEERPASEAERALRSIATMLGWGNVPPQHVLEAEIRALKGRLDVR